MANPEQENPFVPFLPQNNISNNFCEGNMFYIYGEFDESIGRLIIPNMIKVIDEQSMFRSGNISIFINSNGGYVRYLYDLLALIERAKAMGVVVETFVFGCAYSCGSILAASGTKGHRYIGENAEHLCHLGSAQVEVTSDEELKRQSEKFKNHFRNMRRLYKKYAKVENLDKAIQTDSYFIRGKDLIKNGLADEMFHP